MAMFRTSSFFAYSCSAAVIGAFEAAYPAGALFGPGVKASHKAPPTATSATMAATMVSADTRLLVSSGSGFSSDSCMNTAPPRCETPGYRPNTNRCASGSGKRAARMRS